MKNLLYIIQISLVALAGCKKDPEPELPLQPLKSANCFIVSEAGRYSFETVKGEGNESVGEVVAAEVLWESFGTDKYPSAGSLIKSVSYKEGEIIFKTTDKKGNAVIAAKDADDNILWSWHIQMTDQPKTVEVATVDNRKNSVMDRNVGASGVHLTEYNIFGLYYYNRSNHPFIGPASLQNSNLAKGTVEWAEFYKENPSYGSDAAEYYNWRSVDPCPAGWEVMTIGTVSWTRGLGLSGASEGGYDINATDIDTSFDNYVQDSLLFPYGGIRNDDGSYSYVNKISYMLLQIDNEGGHYTGWN